MDYRALGVLDRGNIIWFWIGSHQEYDRLLRYMIVLGQHDEPWKAALGASGSPGIRTAHQFRRPGPVPGVQLRGLRHRKAQAVPTQAMRPITVGFVHLQGPAKVSLNLPMPSEWGAA